MKYSFTKETVHHEGQEYRQIVAEKNFATRNGLVRKGELGGFISNGNGAILSQEGTCWVHPTSYISGDVKITDQVEVYDSDIHGTEGRIIVEGLATVDNSVVYSTGNVHLNSVYVIGTYIKNADFVPVHNITIPAKSRFDVNHVFKSMVHDDVVLKVYTMTNEDTVNQLYIEIETIEFIGNIPLIDTVFELEAAFDEEEIYRFLNKTDIFNDVEDTMNKLRQMYAEVCNNGGTTKKGDVNHVTL